jgi:hypothetical protein
MVKDEVERVAKKVVVGAYNIVAKYLLLILVIIVLVLCLQVWLLVLYQMLLC